MLVLAAAVPGYAQIELSGAYSTRMYVDYIERVPGEFMGNFTGMPLSDVGARRRCFTRRTCRVYLRAAVFYPAGRPA